MVGFFVVRVEHDGMVSAEEGMQILPEYTLFIVGLSHIMPGSIAGGSYEGPMVRSLMYLLRSIYLFYSSLFTLQLNS